MCVCHIGQRNGNRIAADSDRPAIADAAITDDSCARGDFGLRTAACADRPGEAHYNRIIVSRPAGAAFNPGYATQGQIHIKIVRGAMSLSGRCAGGNRRGWRRLRAVSPAGAQIAAEPNSAPDDHLAAGPDCGVELPRGRIDGAGASPAVSAGIVSSARIHQAAIISAPDDHFGSRSKLPPVHVAPWAHW